ncbi:hypothetical protein M9458_055278, partial [Cirrhinus mrigala]
MHAQIVLDENRSGKLNKPTKSSNSTLKPSIVTNDEPYSSGLQDACHTQPLAIWYHQVEVIKKAKISIRQNMLELSIKSSSLGYKQEKVCLVLEIKDSQDPLVMSAKVLTGHKWK